MPNLKQMLETKDRKEQEKRVATLIQMAQAPNFSITIHVARGGIDYQTLGNPQGQDVLKSLDLVRDDFLLKAARDADGNSGAPSDFPPDMPPPEALGEDVDMDIPPVGSEEEELQADSMG